MGARIRTIKPSFWGDEKIGSLSRPARLTFLGLISVASDDQGRCRGNPRGVRSTVYQLDDDITVEEVALHLTQLEQAGLITCYTVQREPYIHVVNFNKHQKIDRPNISQLPPPPEPNASSSKSIEPLATGRRDIADASAIARRDIVDNSSIPRCAFVEDSTSARPVVESSVKERKQATSATYGRKAGNVQTGAVPTDSNPFPKDVCDRLYEVWLSTGHSVDYARFRKVLKPLFPTSGPRFEGAVLAKAIVAFNEAADGVSPDKSQFWHINKFVDDVGRWVRLGAMPLTDLNGLTERGRAAMGAGL